MLYAKYGIIRRIWYYTQNMVLNRHEKRPKMSSTQIWWLLNVHTFTLYKIQYMRIMVMKTIDRVLYFTITYKQMSTVFPQTCPQTRFVGLRIFLCLLLNTEQVRAELCQAQWKLHWQLIWNQINKKYKSYKTFMFEKSEEDLYFQNLQSKFDLT